MIRTAQFFIKDVKEFVKKPALFDEIEKACNEEEQVQKLDYLPPELMAFVQYDENLTIYRNNISNYKDFYSDLDDRIKVMEGRIKKRAVMDDVGNITYKKFSVQQ